MNTPADLQYTSDHEWIKDLGDGTHRIGITDYAQDQLGDIVYVDLPETDGSVESGSVIVEVESTKSVGEVYAPMRGTITGVNEAVIENPELVNQEPYGEGWLVEMYATEIPDDLLTSEEYQKLVE